MPFIEPSLTVGLMPWKQQRGGEFKLSNFEKSFTIALIVLHTAYSKFQSGVS